MEPLRFNQQTLPPSRRTTTRNAFPADFDADEGLYPVKSRTSAVRYVDTQGHQVIQRGNQQFILHDEPPPRKRRRPHWLVIFGLSMLVLLLLWTGLSWVTWWIAANQLNATYEFPRVSQVDAVVYPGDRVSIPATTCFSISEASPGISPLMRCALYRVRAGLAPALVIPAIISPLAT